MLRRRTSLWLIATRRTTPHRSNSLGTDRNSQRRTRLQEFHVCPRARSSQPKCRIDGPRAAGEQYPPRAPPHFTDTPAASSPSSEGRCPPDTPHVERQMAGAEATTQRTSSSRWTHDAPSTTAEVIGGVTLPCHRRRLSPGYDRRAPPGFPSSNTLAADAPLATSAVCPHDVWTGQTPGWWAPHVATRRARLSLGRATPNGRPRHTDARECRQVVTRVTPLAWMAPAAFTSPLRHGACRPAPLVVRVPPTRCTQPCHATSRHAPLQEWTLTSTCTHLRHCRSTPRDE